MKNPFEYQAPTSQHVYNITNVRDACKALYEILQVNVPVCAERTLAMRALEECSMWANKAIVFDGEAYLPK